MPTTIQIPATPPKIGEMIPLVRALGTITAALLSLQTLASGPAVLGSDAHPAASAQNRASITGVADASGSDRTGKTTDPAEFAEDTKPAVTLRVAPETPLVTSADAPVSFTVRVTNEGERETDPQTLTLEMETSRLTSATLETPFGENSSVSVPTKSLAQTRVPVIGPKETHEAKLTVNAATLNPGIVTVGPVPADGAYRVRAMLGARDNAAGEAAGSNTAGDAAAGRGGEATSGDATAGSDAAGVSDAASASDNIAASTDAAAGSDAATASDITSIVWQTGAAAGTPVASSATTLDDGTAAHINPVQLAVIVPITLPSEITQLPTAAELGDITASGGPLDRLLSAAEQTHATLAIDPRLIVAIRGHGENAPDSATELLQRLESTTLPSFLLQFNDADLSTQAALGYTIPLQPLGFTELTSSGVFASAPPSDAELVSWTETAGKIAWPAAGALTPETVKLAGNAGHTKIISDSSAVIAADGPRGTLTVDDAPFEVLVANSVIAEAAAKLSSASTTLDAQSGAAELATLLAVAGGTAVGGSASTLITLDRATLANVSNPEAVLQTLTSLDWAQFVTTDQLLSGTVSLADGGAVTSGGGESGSTSDAEETDWRSDRLAQLQEVFAKAPEINTRAGVLEQPELLNAAWQLEQLQLLNAGAAVSESAHEEALAHTNDWLQQMLHGIKLVSADRTQLIGTSSQIPLQIKNSMPYRATVKIHLALGSSALLPAQTDFETVSLQPSGTTTVLVPVQSRIASGTANIVIDITDTSGEIPITTKTLTILITSFVESVSIIVVSAAAVLFIGFGIVRSARRKKLLGAHAQGGGDAGGSDGAGGSADDS